MSVITEAAIQLKGPKYVLLARLPSARVGPTFFDRNYTKVISIRIISAASAEITRVRIKMEATRTAVFTSFSLMRSDCMRLQRLRKSWRVPSSELQQHRAGVANAVLECHTRTVNNYNKNEQFTSVRRHFVGAAVQCFDRNGGGFGNLPTVHNTLECYNARAVFSGRDRAGWQRRRRRHSACRHLDSKPPCALLCFPPSRVPASALSPCPKTSVSSPPLH